jgi:hypothetical protein
MWQYQDRVGKRKWSWGIDEPVFLEGKFILSRA